MAEDVTVKQRGDSMQCSSCGRPTSSLDGLCTSCRVPAATPAPPPVVGLPAAQEPQPVMPALNDEGKLAEDVHCRRCGYNLRGLAPSAACPECELPAARSLFGDRLRYSDPAWVRRLHRGMWLLIGSILASVVATVVGVVVMMAFAGAAGGAMSITAVTAFAALSTVFTVLWVAAVWMLTTPDPGTVEIEGSMNARTIARWCVMASLAAVPISTFQQQWMGGPQMPAAPGAIALLDALMFIAGIVLGLIALIGTAAGFIYLRSLALRIPAPRLAHNTRIAGWGYVATSAAGQVFGVVTWLVVGGGVPGAGAMPPGLIAIGMGFCVLGLATLAFGVWAIVLLFIYAGEFGKAHSRAEQFARSGTPSLPAAPV